MNTNNADTTGLRGIPRAKALIACAEAQDAGKTIQIRGEFYEKWEDALCRCDFGDRTTNYRVKPEPVVTTATEYQVFVQGLSAPVLVTSDRDAAASYIRDWCGGATLECHYITLEHGVEIRRVIRDGRARRVLGRPE